MPRSGKSHRRGQRRPVLVLPSGALGGERAPDLRECAACARQVERKDCHRNRYREYICRECQSSGRRFTIRGKMQKTTKRVGKTMRMVGWTLFFLLAAASYWGVTHDFSRTSKTTFPRKANFSH